MKTRAATAARQPASLPGRLSWRGVAGQSLLESCIVIAILCLLFMLLVQLSQLYMAQEILHYAAGRGARAKTVGFNDFMVHKVVRVGTIATAGKLIVPELGEQPQSLLDLRLGSRFYTQFPVSTTRGPMVQRLLEEPRIPLYLGAYMPASLPGILDYEEWDTVHYNYSERQQPPGLTFTVRQDFPLKFPLHRAFYADDAIPFVGRADMENHYPLYLDTD